MKNITEILKTVGVILDEDAQTKFDKLFNDNYKTIKELENLRNKLTSAEQQNVDYKADIEKRDEDLKTLKNQLKEAKTDTDKLQALQSQMDELQQTYNTSKSDYEKKLADQKYEFIVKDYINGLKFSSNSAKKAFTQDLLDKGLQVENDKLLGFDDFVSVYKENDSGAFMSEDTQPNPVPTITFTDKTSNTSTSQQINQVTPKTNVIW